MRGIFFFSLCFPIQRIPHENKNKNAANQEEFFIDKNQYHLQLLVRLFSAITLTINKINCFYFDPHAHTLSPSFRMPLNVFNIYVRLRAHQYRPIHCHR